MPRRSKCSGSMNKAHVLAEEGVGRIAPEKTLVKATPTPSRAAGRSWAGVVKESTSSPTGDTDRQLVSAEHATQSAILACNPLPAAMLKHPQVIGSATEPLRPGGLGTCLCRGRVAQLKSTYGWIQPLDAIEHPDLQHHGGLIWFSFRDVRPGTLLFSGNDLMFGLYADIDGLGAEDICEIYGKSSVSSAPTASELKPALPVASRTPLSFSSKSFTPLLECHYSTDAALQYCSPMEVQLHCDDEKLPAGKNGTTANEQGESKKPETIETLKKSGKQDLPGPFLPPPGLPAPPGLEDCTSLKMEG